MCKKIFSLILVLALILGTTTVAFASDLEDNLNYEGNIGAEIGDASASGLELDAKSVILMDAKTGTVMYSKNAHEALPPASVTKVMTLLLVAEAIAQNAIALDNEVVVSANAASKGGSQIFLKEGESLSVEDLLKSTIIASANDAAVALAELVAGSETAFVTRMNERANELGMKNTVFENATGLDDSVTDHLTSAYDIALMSRERLKHDIILKYSNAWQDSIRGGEFVLTNTNRLVRYYSGCTGLKTGSTDKAGFCISATAERDGMHLIAVVMGSSTRDERNNAARALLDYGFATYGVYTDPKCELEDVAVKKGVCRDVTVYSEEFSILTSKADIRDIEKKYNIPEALTAPLNEGDKVGEVIYLLNGNEIGRSDIKISAAVERIGLMDIILMMLSEILLGNSR